MNNYTYTELMDKTENELLVIKKEKQDELHVIQSRKLVIIGNIMALQGMMKEEIQKMVIPK